MAIIILSVVVSAIVAIAAHAALPAKVDTALLDGALVQRFGFPVVAVVYFLVLFTHAALVAAVSRRTTRTSAFGHGLRLGSAFAVMYLIGMQEIMLDASPFPAWNWDFILYQAIIGLGDAIPVILLCVVVSTPSAAPSDPVERKSRIRPAMMLIMAAAVGTTRWIMSGLGVIESSLADYPLGVVGWGYLLGLGFGIAFLLLTETGGNGKAIMIYGVCLNWIIFNAFIGLVFAGKMGDALLRSSIDAAAIALSMALITALESSAAKEA